MPLAGALVVKKGSNAWRAVSSLMPLPESRTSMHTKASSAGRAPSPPLARAAARAGGGSSALATATSMVPGPWIASCAFTTRFITDISSWATSMVTGQVPGATCTVSRISCRTARCRNSPKAAITLARSTVCSTSGWRLAKASSCCVSLLPRAVACLMVVSALCCSSGRACARCASVTLLLTTCSRLLKSCATPPVSWPMASMR